MVRYDHQGRPIINGRPEDTLIPASRRRPPPAPAAVHASPARRAGSHAPARGWLAAGAPRPRCGSGVGSGASGSRWCPSLTLRSGGWDEVLPIPGAGSHAPACARARPRGRADSGAVARGRDGGSGIIYHASRGPRREHGSLAANVLGVRRASLRGLRGGNDGCGQAKRVELAPAAAPRVSPVRRRHLRTSAFGVRCWGMLRYGDGREVAA